MKTKKRLTNHYLLAFTAVISLLPAVVFAQEDFIEKHDKEFAIKASPSFSIENKYGNIDIRDWTKSSIKIEAEIKLYDVSKQKADEIFQHVSIKMEQSGNSIEVETVYDEEFFKLVGKHYKMNDKQFDVNYVVHLPALTNVTAQNKYGDIFISRLDAPAAIILKYGTLKINQLNAKEKAGMSDLELAYSKGSIEKCEWMRISSRYSTLSIDEATALISLSKYSKLFVDKVSSLVCESKYDTYQIGILRNFVAEAQYGNYRLDEIHKKLSLDTKYTDVKVRYMPASFEEIEIDNSYGSVQIGIDDNASYKLRAEAKYAKVNYPESARVNKFQENTEQRLEGYVGPAENTNSTVEIDTRYGGVKLY